MKKINLTIIVILFVSFVYAQNDYYWSADKKHYLKQQTNAFVVKLYKELSFDSAQKIKSDRNFKEVTKMKRDLGIVVPNDTLVNTKKLKEYKEFSNAMPVYQLGDLPFFLTGEILMQPKHNTSVEDILKLVNNRVFVKNRTKYNTFVLETEDWDKLFDYSNLIYESGLVGYCHPNFIAPRIKHQINDPKYIEQYYLNNTGQFGGTAGIDINAPEAWGIITVNSPITVAVIDDGVEAHEDLGDRVLQGFTPQFSLQNPDTQGAPNENDPPDSHIGHGQCCAGIIGASHNSLGIRGVAPEVDIVPINIFNDWFTYLGEVYYSEDIQDIVAAIDFAWDDTGADVISNSWSFVNPDANFEAVTQAIGRARTLGRIQGINHLGCVVVFASGNDTNPYNHLTVRFPANVNGVLTVGAVDKNGNIWNYSCRGNSMDLVAPSGALDLNGDVRTIDREGNDGYETGNYTDQFGGTSATCPQVAGVAALMLSVNPFLTEAEVRTTLQQTATDMGMRG
jgi:subtilisin family serine protease